VLWSKATDQPLLWIPKAPLRLNRQVLWALLWIPKRARSNLPKALATESAAALVL
jgi:hypothetical protein